MEQAVREILEFWFGDDLKPRKIWFVRNLDFDEAIRSRFLSLHTQAATGKLDAWITTPESCLALVLLLDQFSRNMFRGQLQAFATDPKARQVAQMAIDQQFDQSLPPVQRQFFYYPLEHTEDLECQYQAVKLFEQFKDNAELDDSYVYALKHRDIIERFGRFPHRNSILGRASTPEEIEFLKQPGSSF
jgi:uncharacterized protein (DUF924 family)